MMSDDGGRELMHTREIVCKAYRRRDGLWEIEGQVRDDKAHEVSFRSRSPWKAGESIHLLSLTLVIDNDYTIQAAQAKTSIAPWPGCGETDTAYRQLVGLRIGPGFNQQVRKLLGGTLGCTHLTDLLGELATTYIQASWPDRDARQRKIAADPRHWPDRRTLAFIGQCYAWREGGTALCHEYPELAEDFPSPDK